jgi:hypothetical protein
VEGGEEEGDSKGGVEGEERREVTQVEANSPTPIQKLFQTETKGLEPTPKTQTPNGGPPNPTTNPQPLPVMRRRRCCKRMHPAQCFPVPLVDSLHSLGALPISVTHTRVPTCAALPWLSVCACVCVRARVCICVCGCLSVRLPHPTHSCSSCSSSWAWPLVMGLAVEWECLVCVVDWECVMAEEQRQVAHEGGPCRWPHAPKRVPCQATQPSALGDAG